MMCDVVMVLEVWWCDLNFVCVWLCVCDVMCVWLGEDGVWGVKDDLIDDVVLWNGDDDVWW